MPISCGKSMVKGMPVCARMQQMAYPALTKAFLQADPTAAMHCHPEWCTHPPPPVPPFLLAQNLSSKQIAPTDNMRSKTDNTKRHHWLLKGFKPGLMCWLTGSVELLRFQLAEKLVNFACNTTSNSSSGSYLWSENESTS